MRIALELQPCCWQRSGIGSYTYEIVRRLHDTSEMTFHGNLFNFLGRRDNTEALKDIPFPVNVNRLFPYGVYRRIWDYLPISYDRMFSRADVSVFFNFIVPKRVGGKIVAVVHDLTYLRFPETMKESNYAHLKAGMAYSIQRSDMIVTTSAFTKREMQELLDVPAEKMEIVHSAPALEEQEADFAEVQRKYGIRPPYLLFVSTLEPRKNLVRLMEAFEQLKDHDSIPHQLVLAGGKGWRDEEILRKAEGSPYRGSMVFTGFVTNEEKNTLYKHSDMLVFPSVYEGFGMPPLEAMHFGCPVVCANAASIPEIVGDAAVLVDPFDTDSIADGMRRVLTDRELAEDLRRKGKQRAGAFTWEKSVDELYGVIKTVSER